ncbi:MAG: ABC transporter substrate-binding protein [Christensenellales bacterium]|jgi:peptide/nickel transport system substrate-binding protein
MRRYLSLLLVIALATTALFSATAFAENAGYAQSPMLDALVESGTLPPVEERLPENPKLINESSPEALEYEVGNYGGTIRFVTSSVNFDADCFIAQTENILNMVDSNSSEITPNLVEYFTVENDNTVFTFKLRNGLKWSDGTPVTIEDFRFTVENVIFNEELTPSVPTAFRAGGSSTGEPMQFEVLDEQNFRITFTESFGGFLVYMSIKGWQGYCDIVKPSDYLKPYHIDYAEECHGSLDAYYAFIAPFAASLGYDDPAGESVWTYVFHNIDLLNWELTNPIAALTATTFAEMGVTENFPVLYPYVMTGSDGGVMTWERNPYYHKVDAAGNQLPYVDVLTSTLVEDAQMVQMKVVSGEVDWLRMLATIDNVALYRENEHNGYTAHIRPQHVTPTDIILNLTYGMNDDGSVKDDDESRAWQEMIQELDFRKALAYAIDPEEIIDSVYYGFADVNDSYYNATYDPDYANELLDGLGMMDIDGDGYRETPSGLAFMLHLFNCNQATDLIPVAELAQDFWREIGIKTDIQTTEYTLIDTMTNANELPTRVIWIHEGELWHYGDWQNHTWGTLYQKWYSSGGLNADEDSIGVAPEGAALAFYELYDTLFTVTPDEAVNQVVPELHRLNAENYWVLMPITNVSQCLITNSDMGNIPNDTVNACAIGFVIEQVFYRTPQD